MIDLQTTHQDNSDDCTGECADDESDEGVHNPVTMNQPTRNMMGMTRTQISATPHFSRLVNLFGFGYNVGVGIPLL